MSEPYRVDDVVWVAVSYNSRGVVMQWVRGEITHVYHARNRWRYCIRRTDTREELSRKLPEDVKPWDWEPKTRP